MSVEVELTMGYRWNADDTWASGEFVASLAGNRLMLSRRYMDGMPDTIVVPRAHLRQVVDLLSRLERLDEELAE